MQPLPRKMPISGLPRRSQDGSKTIPACTVKSSSFILSLIMSSYRPRPAKLPPSRLQDASRWQLDPSKLPPRRLKMATSPQLGPTWAHLGPPGGAPNKPPRPPKDPPRTPPRGFKMAPRGSQATPKRTPRCSFAAFGSFLGRPGRNLVLRLQRAGAAVIRRQAF